MSRVQRTTNACTAIVRSGARENAKNARTREAVEQREEDQRLVREQRTIEEKARRKAEVTTRRRTPATYIDDASGRWRSPPRSRSLPRQSRPQPQPQTRPLPEVEVEQEAQETELERHEAEVDDEESRGLGVVEQRPQAEEDYAVGDVDWTEHYGVTPAESLPQAMRDAELTSPALARAADGGVPAVCDGPVEAAEIWGYVAHVRPPTFAWGSAPSRDGEAWAYHAERGEVMPGGTLMYAVRRTRLTIVDDAWAYVPTTEKLSKLLKDTPEALLRQLYQPGMLVDVDTLVAVLARRGACVLTERQFAERRSYAIFEQWLASALELGSDAVLAYVAGILGSRHHAEQVYADCQLAAAAAVALQAQGEPRPRPCRELLIELLHRLRLRRWHVA
jgi:hypothetical protein